MVINNSELVNRKPFRVSKKGVKIDLFNKPVKRIEPVDYSKVDKFDIDCKLICLIDSN
jgi:hypothetical protein